MKPIPIPPAAMTAILAGAVGGPAGHVPNLAIVSDGDRRVLQVGPWSQATAIDPTAVSYAGSSGLVSNLEDGADLRGPATIATLGYTQDPGASLTLDPTSGDVYQVTGT